MQRSRRPLPPEHPLTIDGVRSEDRRPNSALPTFFRPSLFISGDRPVYRRRRRFVRPRGRTVRLLTFSELTQCRRRPLRRIANLR